MAKCIIPQALIAREGVNFTRLSDLFSDPDLRRFFRDGERDQGFAFCIPDPDSPVFGGGAEAEMEEVA